MAERLYYAKAGEIDPLAVVLENVAVFIKAQWHCYRVIYLEPLPRSSPLVFDQGAIPAGGATGDIILTNLAQQETPPAMAQLRFFPLDDIEVTFKIGQAEARFTAQRFTATASLFTLLTDPDLHSTEVLVLRNNTPFLNCANPTDYDITMSRVAFFGFRYQLQDLKIAVASPQEVKSKLQGQAVVFVPAGSD